MVWVPHQWPRSKAVPWRLWIQGRVLPVHPPTQHSIWGPIFVIELPNPESSNKSSSRKCSSCVQPRTTVVVHRYWFHGLVLAEDLPAIETDTLETFHFKFIPCMPPFTDPSTSTEPFHKISINPIGRTSFFPFIKQFSEGLTLAACQVEDF
jgi:hypothetical protein